ncbi:DUF72 domain-containing protein [Vibrio sp. DNF-1]|nr:DUF72 domain-containing protein [Vibrio salinus]MCE0496288.1 DUF72 domain-containing protein [Vibrio salinus]
MWSHSPWQQSLFGPGTKPSERLEKYARFFNTVEGNTTFYATPSVSTVKNWSAATPGDFSFTFKLPKNITHSGNLRTKRTELYAFLSIMEPVMEKIGLWTIQLPASFSPEHLSDLQTFVRYFPQSASLAIEVRHQHFFSKGPEEKAFNAWLIDKNLDRIIMDSRPIFSVSPTGPLLADAQKKKPKVPVHAISTANHPLIRFIGLPSPADNTDFIQPWIGKLSDWMSRGKIPYLMVHTANNDYAPELAMAFYDTLCKQCQMPERAVLLNENHQPQMTMF